MRALGAGIGGKQPIAVELRRSGGGAPAGRPSPPALTLQIRDSAFWLPEKGWGRRRGPRVCGTARRWPSGNTLGAPAGWVVRAGRPPIFPGFRNAQKGAPFLSAPSASPSGGCSHVAPRCKICPILSPRWGGGRVGGDSGVQRCWERCTSGIAPRPPGSRSAGSSLRAAVEVKVSASSIYDRQRVLPQR
jgi:hypothetical protein